MRLAKMRLGLEGGELVFATAAVCLAVAFASQTVSAASTFHWKLDSSTWGDPNDPANWDVGSAGGGNPSGLVPSSADSIYTGSYLFDLAGGSLTAGTIMYVGVSWDALRTFQVTNGTFTLATKMQTRSVHMDIWAGGKVVFPAGSTWFRGDGMGNDRYGVDVVHAGGRLELLGTVKPWHANVTVEDGGYLLMDPTSIDLSSSWFPSHFVNCGTCEMPNGVQGVPSGQNNNGKVPTFNFTQRAGTWRIGGPFAWFDALSAITANRSGEAKVTIEGGRIEATGRVTFPYVQTCSVKAGASVTVDVAAGALFELSVFELGSGASIVKTGAGAIFVDSAIPPALRVQEGFVGFRSPVTDETVAGLQGVGGICFGAPGNRLDSFAGYQSFGWSLDGQCFSDGDVVFSSSDAAIREFVLESIEANLPASSSVQLAVDGENIVVVPRSYIYDITVQEGETNGLDSATATMKLGTNHITTAQFSTLTLHPNSVINKYGGGTLRSSSSLAGFTGQINVRGGVLSVTGVNQLGSEEEGGNAPEVRVFDGATLAIETSSGTAAANAIKLRNAIRLAGSGHGGLGALLLNSSNSQRNIFSRGSTITFDGDALIGSTCSVMFDNVGSGFVMNGHTVTLRNLLGTGAGHSTFTFGSPQFIRPGNMVVDRMTLSMQSAKGIWGGSAENTLTLTNSAILSFYSTRTACEWKLVCHEGSAIGPGGADTVYSDVGVTNVNLWCGPVRLEGDVTLSISSPHRGFAFLGPVSGPGGIVAKGCWAQLANPNNSFEGGVTAQDQGNGIGGIAAYADGAIPCAATLKGAELRLMDATKQYSLPALALEEAAGKKAVLNVNSAAGCAIGDLAGFGVVSNGGVTVTGRYTMPRAGLESGGSLAVDGGFTYAASASAAVDDLPHLARGEYVPVRAEGGVLFNGADTLESPLSIAGCWHFLPAGPGAIALRFACGTTIVVR